MAAPWARRTVRREGREKGNRSALSTGLLRAAARVATPCRARQGVWQIWGCSARCRHRAAAGLAPAAVARTGGHAPRQRPHLPDRRAPDPRPAQLRLPERARVGLVRRNGAGKTTLFRIIHGEIGSEGGEIALPKGTPHRRGGAGGAAAPRPCTRWCSPPTPSAPACSSRPRPPRACAGPRSRPASSTSTPTRPRRGRPRSCTASASTRRRKPAPARISPAAGAMRVALAAVLFSEPDLLLSTSRPTTSTSRARSGSTTTSNAIPAPRSSSATTATLLEHLGRPHPPPRPRAAHALSRRLHLVRPPALGKARPPGQGKAKQEAERAHLQSFIDRFKAKATKARQAQSRMKRLAKMEPIAALIEDDVPVIHLPSPPRVLSPPLVSMERVSRPATATARSSAAST